MGLGKLVKDIGVFAVGNTREVAMNFSVTMKNCFFIEAGFLALEFIPSLLGALNNTHFLYDFMYYSFVADFAVRASRNFSRKISYNCSERLRENLEEKDWSPIRIVYEMYSKGYDPSVFEKIDAPLTGAIGIVGTLRDTKAIILKRKKKIVLSDEELEQLNAVYTQYRSHQGLINYINPHTTYQLLQSRAHLMKLYFASSKSVQQFLLACDYAHFPDYESLKYNGVDRDLVEQYVKDKKCGIDVDALVKRADEQTRNELARLSLADVDPSVAHFIDLYFHYKSDEHLRSLHGDTNRQNQDVGRAYHLLDNAGRAYLSQIGTHPDLPEDVDFAATKKYLLAVDCGDEVGARRVYKSANENTRGVIGDLTAPLES